MTGTHSPDNRSAPPGLIEPSARPQEMPDPDNLYIDLSALPKTGPITLPKRN
ncbi:hypothetical protein BH11ACT4_BH11ACT4_23150 [soil metagenome]